RLPRPDDLLRSIEAGDPGRAGAPARGSAGARGPAGDGLLRRRGNLEWRRSAAQVAAGGARPGTPAFGPFAGTGALDRRLLSCAAGTGARGDLAGGSPRKSRYA